MPEDDYQSGHGTAGSIAAVRAVGRECLGQPGVAGHTEHGWRHRGKWRHGPLGRLYRVEVSLVAAGTRATCDHWQTPGRARTARDLLCPLRLWRYRIPGQRG